MAPTRASAQRTATPDADRLQQQAQRLADAASNARSGTGSTVAALGLDDVVLPPTVLEAAAEVLREQARGHEPEIVVVRESLSTQQAADLLGISRPHLTMLLDRDRIPYQTTPGGHRRIRRSDIEDYQERQEQGYALMRESMRASERLADDE